jgi:hypothetical protein
MPYVKHFSIFNHGLMLTPSTQGTPLYIINYKVDNKLSLDNCVMQALPWKNPEREVWWTHMTW